MNRGVMRVNRGELEEAVADFDKAIQTRPSFLPAHANRAITLARLGQVKRALVQIRHIAETNLKPDTTSSLHEIFEWIDIPDPDTESCCHFYDEVAKILSEKKGTDEM